MQPKSIYCHVADADNTLRSGTTNYSSCMMRSAKPEHRNKTLHMQMWRTTTTQEQSSPDISFNRPELRGMSKLNPSVWKRTPQNSGDSPSCSTKINQGSTVKLPRGRTRHASNEIKQLSKNTYWRMHDWCDPDRWTRSRNQNVKKPRKHQDQTKSQTTWSPCKHSLNKSTHTVSTR